MKTIKIKIDDAKKLVVSVLTNNSIPSDEVEIVANVYLEAELRDKKSHGLQLLPTFIKRFPSSDIKIIGESENTLFVDGGSKFGPVTGTFTMKRLIAKMEKTAIAVAHGGTDTILGSNPLAISVPTRGEPITFDMGTTEITYFKIVESRHLNKKLPEGSVLDDAGNFTTDPHKANLRRLLPLAGHKGFGLAFMIELLTAALSKSPIGKEKAGTITGEHYATTMIVLKADTFISTNDFYDSVEKLVNGVKDSAKAKGFDEILIPSERSRRHKKEALRKGEIETARLPKIAT